MPDRISAFVEAVGAEIRWKKARPLLTEEIRTHLLDQRDACVAQGMAEDEAQAEAVRQMGDPVALGADLDRVHRPRPQWGLLALALMLAAAGAFLRFSLTADVPYVSLQDRQMDLLGGLMGAAALAAGYLLDVSTLGRRAGWTCVALAAGVLCFLPWRVNGPAWLSAQLLSLFALTLALVLWKQRGRRWRGAAVCLSWTALAAAACCLCPSVYALVQVTMAALVLGLFFAWRDWLGLGRWKSVVLVLALGLGVLALIVAVRWERLQSNLFADLSPANPGYIAFILREALSLARWIGPAENPAWAAEEGFTLQQAVPEMDSDALLVNLICTWGWLPFLVLVGAFLAFFLWLLWKTIHLRQTLGRAVCLAALTTLAVQMAVSLSLTLGAPVLSGGFPLVVGNVNTVVDMLLIGLALSALRDGGLPETAPALCRNRSAAFRRVRWENGELIFSLRPRQG